MVRHREENGSFESIDQLDHVPGFPKAFLTDLKTRVDP